MAATPQQGDALKEIQRAWAEASEQLAALREQVAEAGELAQLKLQSAVLERDRDRALRDFGEAVWQAVQRGTVKLPASVAAAQKGLEAVLAREQAHAADVAELLKEGEEAAERRKAGKAKGTSKTVKR
ncbi:MAG: hypothetical protein FJ086_19770 [Deltaproteobacteria bacterium]|nr:hypothetical protein [Deltaproteobacteria bacterium]